jgi:hypothetical protein
MSMDEEIIFLKRLRYYIPILTWNITAVVTVSVVLLTNIRFWGGGILVGLVAIAGDYFWLQKRDSRVSIPLRIAWIDRIQLFGLGAGFVGFLAWSIYDYQSWKLVTLSSIGVLLVMRVVVLQRAALRNRI